MIFSPKKKSQDQSNGHHLSPQVPREAEKETSIADFNKKKNRLLHMFTLILTQNLDLEFWTGRLGNQMQFHAEQTFKMHSFRQEGWKLQLLHIQYIDFIPYCSVLKKVVRGKTRGAAAKNRWTLPLKICIYPGMKKGCLCVAVGMPWTTRCICYAYIHSVKLTPSL